MIASNQIAPIFGVFQNLLSVKSTEVHAFKLLSALISALPEATFLTFSPQLLQLLLTRLMKESGKYGNSKYSFFFIHAISHMISTFGPMRIYQNLETITPGLVEQLASKVWPDTINGCGGYLTDKEGRLLVLGLAKLSIETPVNQNQMLFGGVVKQILTILAFMNGADFHSAQEDIIISFEEEDFESREFDSVYSKLKYASVPDFAPPSECSSASIYFARKLSELGATRPGYYSALIRQSIDSVPDKKKELAEALNKVLSEAGVSLA